MLDEEARDRIFEFAKEIAALMDEHDLRFWQGGIVRVAPAGAAPAFCTVRIEGVDDENVMWTGVPGTLSVGDTVTVWEDPETHRREILSTGGGTAWALPIHDHSGAAQGGQDLRQIQELEFDDATILTIDVNGTITRTQVYHIVAANAGVADDLDQIDGGVEGDVLIIWPDAGDTITVRHNAGGAGDNIWLAGGTNIVLDNDDHLILIYDANGWWCDLSGGAGALAVHDHSGALAGGDDLNPETLSQRCFLVGPGCPNATLGAAIVDINLAGPPAAGSEYVAFILGETTEAGDVTVPSWCHVVGLGEQAIVGMGANTLILSSNSSLLDIVVESSDPADGVRCNGVSNVIIRNVKCIQSAAATCFAIYGASSDIRFYDCIAEVPAGGCGFHFANTASDTWVHTSTAIATGAHNAATYGFRCSDTVIVVLDYCTADDGTSFGDGLHLDNTGLTCTTRWCTFIAADDDVYMDGSNPTWYHLDCHWDPNNSTVVAGTHFALPTKRFNQTVIVAEYGGDFQALSEAITWINAMGDAAAGKLYGVWMLHGNFAETGNVTIPQYVHVFGMGEGTEIEMGANTLSLASDTSLQDVVVESSHATTAIDCVNCTNVLFRNVKCIQSAAAFCWFVRGTANVELYNCTAETTVANARGFQVSDGATAFLWDCQAWDGTNFDYGLSLNNVASTNATTMYCRFAGATDDVLCDTAAAWYDLASRYDAQNITVNGTFTPLPQSPVNLDGRADALILDADGDTTISAPTDDQIDIEIAGTDYGELIEHVLGWDDVVDVDTWYDHKIQDATDGDHFRQNAASYPAGWTEVDASQGKSTSSKYSFWYWYCTSVNTTAKYRKQLSATIGGITASAWLSLMWGPFLWRDGQYTADLHYYFGLYSDNGAGAIDEDIYTRVHLMWDSSGATLGSVAWGIRGEEGDGSAGNEFTTPDHTGSWYVFTWPILQPIWMWCHVANAASQNCRAYVSVAPIVAASSTLLLNQNPTNTNWDTTNGVWAEWHESRAGGVYDFNYLGAIDVSAQSL